MLYLDWLWKLLLDERGEGEGDPPADGGQEGEPPVDDTSKPADEGAGGEGEPPEGEEPPATPKYGDFGDNPTVDEVFEALNKTKAEHDAFRKKAGLTEQNLGSLRKTLDNAGITMGEDGRLRLKEGAGKPKTRFSEEHGKLFDPKVLESVRFLIEDMMDNRFSTFSQRTRQEQQFKEVLNKSIDKMYSLYPSLQEKIDGKANPAFNQAFLDRATEILNESYPKLPNGDLLAAHEAAIEMGVSPIAIEKAKIEGANKGKAGKRILGPARASGGKPSATGKKTKEEILAMSPEERADYQRKTLDK